MKYLHLNLMTLKSDLIAALTVLFVLIPQSMAYAQLAGLPVQYGLYASFLPVLFSCLFGSSRFLSTGPVVLISLITAISLKDYAITPESYLIHITFLAFLVGIIQLSAGYLRLGFVVSFVSNPVMVGFTNSIVLIVILFQIPILIGFPFSLTGITSNALLYLTESFSNTHLPTVILSILSTIFILFLNKKSSNTPNTLLLIMLMTIISYFIGFGLPVSEGGLGGATIGFIPSGLPIFKSPLPPVSNIVDLSALLIPAITIAIVGFTEAIGISKSMVATTKDRVIINKELIGQGAGNLSAAFSQGMPVSGSFSRTAVNYQSGAKSKLSSIILFFLLAIFLVFFTPLFFSTPLSTLSVIILISIVNLFKVRPIINYLRNYRYDGYIALFTMFLTLLFFPNIQNGLFAGVVVSLAFFLYKSMTPNFRSLPIQINDEIANERIALIKFSGSLYFANAQYFQTKFIHLFSSLPELQCVIIDMSSINTIDSTGEIILYDLIQSAKKNNVLLVLARAESFEKKLVQSNLEHRYSSDIFFASRSLALKHCIDYLSSGLYNKK